MMIKAFGKNPSGERLKKIVAAPNYRDGSFQNIEPTDVMLKDASYFKMLKDFINKPKSTRPPKVIPTIKTDLHKLGAATPLIVWFGHSSYLLKSGDFTMLVDPVFSGFASPVSMFGKAFDGTGVYTADDFAQLDVVLLTHDHYDHLDYKTVLQLKGKVKQWIVSLGVGEHLEYWGIDPLKIVELNWGDEYEIANQVHITATPARHFSGRGTKRGKTLWSSFVLDIHGKKLFLGGDSGYDGQFKSIGEKYGPFDLALLDGAQYGDAWPHIHMIPEQTVQAAKDLQAKVLLPVHWGKFALAFHKWDEPIERLINAAAKMTLKVTTPMIGETYVIGDPVIENYWWREPQRHQNTK